MGGGGELVLQIVGLCGTAAGALRGASGIHHARTLPERDRRLREAGTDRPVGLPHDLRLGHRDTVEPAHQRQACDVCLGRRSYQLRNSYRIPYGRRKQSALLARRCACHRQGHHPLPCDLLAGVPDVGGRAFAQADRRTRLPVLARRENVEVGRQRRRSDRPRRALWRRSAALFLAARNSFRPGRQLFA